MIFNDVLTQQNPGKRSSSEIVLHLNKTDYHGGFQLANELDELNYQKGFKPKYKEETSTKYGQNNRMLKCFLTKITRK